ncbi:MAG TPA: VTT domain-containing protein [Acidimicrobiales bacterium]|nr:VTT domain-containing protein [Acidimicrobiales bacterium]
MDVDPAGLAALSAWAYAVVLLLVAADAVVPLLPGESVVVVGGVLAAEGHLHPLVLLAAAAVGAVAGDAASYALGRRANRAGRPVHDYRGRVGWVLRWASSALDRRGALVIAAARFVPGGRTAATAVAGYVRFPPGRFLVAASCGGVVWAAYGTALGILGGRAFEDRAGLAVAAGLALALAVTGLVEAARRFRARPPVAGGISDPRPGSRVLNPSLASASVGLVVASPVDGGARPRPGPLPGLAPDVRRSRTDPPAMNALRRSCAPVQVTVTHSSPATVRVRLAGDLDVTGEPLLDDVVVMVLAADPAEVDIDAGDLVFVDLRGLRAIGDLCARLGRHATVTVSRTSRPLDRLVAVCASSGALTGLPASLAPAGRGPATDAGARTDAGAWTGAGAGVFVGASATADAAAAGARERWLGDRRGRCGRVGGRRRRSGAVPHPRPLTRVGNPSPVRPGAAPTPAKSCREPVAGPAR